jgi:hypothetical protein
MIKLFFESGKISLNDQEFILGETAVADEFTIDAELFQGDNLWLTSFNINSVTVNGQIFESSQELLNFFQQ